MTTASEKTEKREREGTPVHTTVDDRLGRLLSMGAAFQNETKSEFIRVAIAERCEALGVEESLKAAETAQQKKARTNVA
jgi:hypothetical protein